ncbi:hypothetical protein RF11_06285 [Thelohanellus kitauei]|uniref:Uncharacterized protein n=1 Tax=Thelohanellus kitauei TaxID=669202 RepID=A0A0C2IRL6_THEKT|nr:hypothetical protein RF11_06285 [Thelohanellus kitauei]
MSSSVRHIFEKDSLCRKNPKSRALVTVAHADLILCIRSLAPVGRNRPDAVEPESEPTDITANIFTSVSPQKFATYLAFTHDVLVPADLTNINISAFVLGPVTDVDECSAEEI